MVKLNIAQAAAHLGLSQDTVRRRLRAGEIPGERVRAPGGFRWMVEVLDDTTNNDQRDDPLHGPGQANGTTVDTDLMEILKGQVQDLRDQLDTRAREISELHQLLAARSLAPGMIRPWWAFWRR